MNQERFWSIFLCLGMVASFNGNSLVSVKMIRNVVSSKMGDFFLLNNQLLGSSPAFRYFISSFHLHILHNCFCVIIHSCICMSEAVCLETLCRLCSGRK